MRRFGWFRLSAVALLLVLTLLPASALGARPQGGGSSHTAHGVVFHSGEYSLRFARKAGEFVLTHHGTSDGLAISEIAGAKVTNVLAHVSSLDLPPSQHLAVLSGRTSWCDFTASVSFIDNIVHVRVALRATAPPPLTPVAPDVTPIEWPSLKSYPERLLTLAQATPVAGSSVFVSDEGMGSDLLYFENFTALGPYFNATQSDPTQGSFTYPNASTESAVGVSAPQFGYELPGAGLTSLPLKQWLTVVDSYIAVGPVKAGESQQASQYMADTDAILRREASPREATPKWRAIAPREIGNLSDGRNLDRVGRNVYLKSYVSDSRNSPELITQLSVLLGLKEFAAHGGNHGGAAARMLRELDGGLSQFYDSRCGTMTNSLSAGSGSSVEESWYDMTNLISLLQLAQLGDQSARHELMASVPTTIKLAHDVHYRFPMDIQCPGLQTTGAPQRDVAGGYAYLMVGLYRLTHNDVYLKEAKASITKLLGYGFFLSYELHMTAYGAAAAEELSRRFVHQPIYHRIVSVTLANFFNSVRLWDCQYGYCSKGRYHTYMGVNPLPWSDYIAMREQYESWLALRAFLDAVPGKPDRTLSPEVDLVKRFETATPDTMVYALPIMLPKGAAGLTPGAYPFVTRNKLGWDIPLEDLREGLSISGTIGQEIYGAGGPLIFAALAQSK